MSPVGEPPVPALKKSAPDAVPERILFPEYADEELTPSTYVPEELIVNNSRGAVDEDKPTTLAVPAGELYPSTTNLSRSADIVICPSDEADPLTVNGGTPDVVVVGSAEINPVAVPPVVYSIANTGVAALLNAPEPSPTLNTTIFPLLNATAFTVTVTVAAAVPQLFDTA